MAKPPEIPPPKRPPKPERELPEEKWPHADLHKRVLAAIDALPTYFKPETHIEGINAPDLHTLNSVLGATIEDQTVTALNAMRPIWDPDKRYALYWFVRQSQTFPDVLLKRSPTSTASGDEIIMGIELKGWYVFAKEGEPNFRFKVTPKACMPADMLVVVPWALSQVISGRPIAFPPYVEYARWAAAMRNYWWQHERASSSDATIEHPTDPQPYPTKSDKIDDRAVSDGGGNFGRFARTNLMDTYLAQTKRLLLCGLPIDKWLSFFQAISDDKGRE